MTGTAEGSRRDGDPPRTWPAGAVLAEDETLHALCSACGQRWEVHRDLGGFRLQCVCGAWVAAPALRAQEPAGAALIASDQAFPEPASWEVEVQDSPRRRTTGSRDLRRASVITRQRSADRALIELVFLMVAFLAPSIIIQFGMVGDDRAIYMPLAGLASSLLVVLIGLVSPGYAFSGFRFPKLRYVAEGLAAAGVALLLAGAWIKFLESRFPGLESDPFAPLEDVIGLPLLIFVVGVVPGIFEEIAFRGLLQGRLTALLGPTEGVLVTGAAFALAHGLSLATPIHLVLGVYLCWLRARSRSLLPGILLHFTYNTSLVLIERSGGF